MPLVNIYPINKVIDHLYIGSIEATQNTILFKYDIDVIISLIDRCHLKGLGFVVHRSFPIEDSIDQDVSDMFDPISDLVRDYINNGKNVLIHCYGGVSRSCAFVMAYLMKYYLAPKEEVELYFKSSLMVKQARPVVDANMGFRLQLIEYEKKLLLDQ